jgi:GxxExxY protein
MDTDTTTEQSAFLESDLTEKIIGAAFKVHNSLGAGFLEKVYEKALLVELAKQGIAAEQQKPFRVLYEGTIVGDYQADLVVGGRVIVECKSVDALTRTHEAQLLNYLKATDLRVGLLFNFSRPKLEFRRFVR